MTRLHWCRRGNAEELIDTTELRAGDMLFAVDMTPMKFAETVDALEARGLELQDDPCDGDAFLVGEVGT